MDASASSEKDRRDARHRGSREGSKDVEDAEKIVEEDVWIAEDLRMDRNVYERLLSHQRIGVRWMWKLHQQGAGGILGDEMGLGKTIQVASLLHAMKRSNKLGTCLIVCPPTVLRVWTRELKIWCGVDFKVLVKREANRSELEDMIRDKEGGVVLSTYEEVRRSYQELRSRTYGGDLHRMTWQYAVLDEGHRVRNPDAQVTLACKSLRTKHRLVLTGSPIQNRLSELWSVMDFAFPGRLGTLPVFEAHFAVPIRLGAYANATSSMAAAAFRCAMTLRDAISPYLLRRRKVEVDLVLPKRTETVLFCRLSCIQRRLYRAYLDSAQCAAILDHKVHPLLGLDALRKICNHPDLYQSETVPSSSPEEESVKSGKMIVLMALLDVWIQQNDRVLVFTQTQQMLDLIEREIACRRWKYFRMDGSTPLDDRADIIDSFQDGKGDVFLLTTRVGGVGLSLVGANRVVLVDPDWNPATDAQAAERAWRIGQKNNVEVVRLVTAGTIEEKIYHRQIHKQMLTERVLRDPAQRRVFANKDLHDLFSFEDNESERQSKLPLNERHCPSDNGNIVVLSERPAEGFTETERIFGIGKDLRQVQVRRFNKPTSGEKSRELGENSQNEESEGMDLLKRLLEGDVTGAASMLRSVVDHDEVTRAASLQAQEDADRDARSIAKRAKEALKQSRKACYATDVHIPTWTGRNGDAGGGGAMPLEHNLRMAGSNVGILNRAITSSRPLAQDIAEARQMTVSDQKASKRMKSAHNGMAAQLLQRARLRECNVPCEALHLLQIINFISAQPGRKATSEELVKEFQDNNGSTLSPTLFKQLLKQVAILRRVDTASGQEEMTWVLKEAFE